MIPVEVAILYQIFSRFFIDFRCFFDAFLQAYFEKNEKWKSAQNTINKHTNSMSGTSKKTQKSTKKSSKNSTKKNIRKRARTTLPGPTFWVKNECIFCPEASREAKNNSSKKNTFFGQYADGFFSIFGSPKGSIYKLCGPLFLAIFRLFSIPVHFRLHLGLFEAIFGPSGGAPTVFS